MQPGNPSVALLSVTAAGGQRGKKVRRAATASGSRREYGATFESHSQAWVKESQSDYYHPKQRRPHSSIAVQNEPVVDSFSVNSYRPQSSVNARDNSGSANASRSKAWLPKDRSYGDSDGSQRSVRGGGVVNPSSGHVSLENPSSIQSLELRAAALERKLGLEPSLLHALADLDDFELPGLETNDAAVADSHPSSVGVEIGPKGLAKGASELDHTGINLRASFEHDHSGMEGDSSNRFVRNGRLDARLVCADDEVELDDFISEFKRRQGIPRAAMRIQSWYRGWKRRKAYRRFMEAHADSTDSTLRRCLFAWSKVAAAQVVFRRASLSSSLFHWYRVSLDARGSALLAASAYTLACRKALLPIRSEWVVCSSHDTWQAANFGMNRIFGDPLPVNLFMLAVQTKRRWLAITGKRMLTRWSRRVVWVNEQKSQGKALLGNILRKRRHEKFILKLTMWYRYSKYKKAEKAGNSFPKFKLSVPFWNQWVISRQRKLATRPAMLKSFWVRWLFGRWAAGAGHIQAKRAQKAMLDASHAVRLCRNMLRGWLQAVAVSRADRMHLAFNWLWWSSQCRYYINLRQNKRKVAQGSKRQALRAFLVAWRTTVSETLMLEINSYQSLVCSGRSAQCHFILHTWMRHRTHSVLAKAFHFWSGSARRQVSWRKFKKLHTILQNRASSKWAFRLWASANSSITSGAGSSGARHATSVPQPKYVLCSPVIEDGHLVAAYVICCCAKPTKIAFAIARQLIARMVGEGRLSVGSSFPEIDRASLTALGSCTWIRSMDSIQSSRLSPGVKQNPQTKGLHPLSSFMLHVATAVLPKDVISRFSDPSYSKNVCAPVAMWQDACMLRSMLHWSKLNSLTSHASTISQAGSSESGIHKLHPQLRLDSQIFAVAAHACSYSALLANVRRLRGTCARLCTRRDTLWVRDALLLVGRQVEQHARALAKAKPQFTVTPRGQTSSIGLSSSRVTVLEKISAKVCELEVDTHKELLDASSEAKLAVDTAQSSSASLSSSQIAASGSLVQTVLDMNREKMLGSAVAESRRLESHVSKNQTAGVGELKMEEGDWRDSSLTTGGLDSVSYEMDQSAQAAEAVQKSSKAIRRDIRLAEFKMPEWLATKTSGTDNQEHREDLIERFVREASKEGPRLVDDVKLVSDITDTNQERLLASPVINDDASTNAEDQPDKIKLRSSGALQVGNVQMAELSGREAIESDDPSVAKEQHADGGFLVEGLFDSSVFQSAGQPGGLSQSNRDARLSPRSHDLPSQVLHQTSSQQNSVSAVDPDSALDNIELTMGEDHPILTKFSRRLQSESLRSTPSQGSLTGYQHYDGAAQDVLLDVFASGTSTEVLTDTGNSISQYVSSDVSGAVSVASEQERTKDDSAHSPPVDLNQVAIGRDLPTPIASKGSQSQSSTNRKVRSPGSKHRAAAARRHSQAQQRNCENAMLKMSKSAIQPEKKSRGKQSAAPSPLPLSQLMKLAEEGVDQKIKDADPCLKQIYHENRGDVLIGVVRERANQEGSAGTVWRGLLSQLISGQHALGSQTAVMAASLMHQKTNMQNMTHMRPIVSDKPSRQERRRSSSVQSSYVNAKVNQSQSLGDRGNRLKPSKEESGQQKHTSKKVDIEYVTTISTSIPVQQGTYQPGAGKSALVIRTSPRSTFERNRRVTDEQLSVGRQVSGPFAEEVWRPTPSQGALLSVGHGSTMLQKSNTNDSVLSSFNRKTIDNWQPFVIQHHNTNNLTNSAAESGKEELPDEEFKSEHFLTVGAARQPPKHGSTNETQVEQSNSGITSSPQVPIVEHVNSGNFNKGASSQNMKEQAKGWKPNLKVKVPQDTHTENSSSHCAPLTVSSPPRMHRSLSPPTRAAPLASSSGSGEMVEVVATQTGERRLATGQASSSGSFVWQRTPSHNFGRGSQPSLQVSGSALKSEVNSLMAHYLGDPVPETLQNREGLSGSSHLDNENDGFNKFDPHHVFSSLKGQTDAGLLASEVIDSMFDRKSNLSSVSSSGLGTSYSKFLRDQAVSVADTTSQNSATSGTGGLDGIGSGLFASMEDALAMLDHHHRMAELDKDRNDDHDGSFGGNQSGENNGDLSFLKDLYQRARARQQKGGLSPWSGFGRGSMSSSPSSVSMSDRKLIRATPRAKERWGALKQAAGLLGKLKRLGGLKSAANSAAKSGQAGSGKLSSLFARKSSNTETKPSSSINAMLQNKSRNITTGQGDSTKLQEAKLKSLPKGGIGSTETTAVKLLDAGTKLTAIKDESMDGAERDTDTGAAGASDAKQEDGRGERRQATSSPQPVPVVESRKATDAGQASAASEPTKPIEDVERDKITGEIFVADSASKPKTGKQEKKTSAGIASTNTDGADTTSTLGVALAKAGGPTAGGSGASAVRARKQMHTSVFSVDESKLGARQGGRRILAASAIAGAVVSLERVYEKMEKEEVDSAPVDRMLSKKEITKNQRLDALLKQRERAAKTSVTAGITRTGSLSVLAASGSGRGKSRGVSEFKSTAGNNLAGGSHDFSQVDSEIEASGSGRLHIDALDSSDAKVLGHGFHAARSILRQGGVKRALQDIAMSSAANAAGQGHLMGLGHAQRSADSRTQSGSMEVDSSSTAGRLSRMGLQAHMLRTEAGGHRFAFENTHVP